MRKAKKEAVEISRYISLILRDYAPNHLTGSQHTLRSYETALTLYVGFLEEQGLTPEDFGASSFDKSKIEDWLVWLAKKRGCSSDTCNNRLASIRAFLKYMASRDVKYSDISNGATTIKLRKRKKRKVNGLSRDAVKTLMGEPDATTHMGIRDLTFMILLYATAIRLDEALSLQLKHVVLDGKACINVVGKGNKLRTLYLLPKAVSHLKQYIDLFHGDKPDPESYLFFSRIKGQYSKMTQAAVAKMLKKYASSGHAKNPEVPLDLHAHQFRHAKASHWFEDGMNIVQISFLLGHAQLQTTMIYLDITTEQETKAMATLESENDKKVSAKWKKAGNSITAMCGLKKLHTT
jgi:site-specific recombinase XerD